METAVKKKKSIINLTITAVTLVFITGTLYYLSKYFFKQSQSEETNDAQVEAYVNPVSARVGGYIAKIRFEENAIVNRGDTLIVLDDREYRIRVAEAEAALEDSRAQLVVLHASIRASRTATTVNEDQILSAKARLWQQEQDMKRFRNLLQEEAVTGQEFEQVKARYDVASNDYNASQHTLTTSFSRIKELEAREALLLADIKRKTAQLDFARVNLSYTVVTAPFTGRLGRRTIHEGLQIQPGQPLVSIINEGNKWVTANYKETQVAGMQPGQAVSIALDALPGKTYHGVIESISGATGSKFTLLPPDNSTGNFVKITQRVPVKIILTDQDLNAVKVGMNATVSIAKAPQP
ncbi:membrane fusion protein, multidrug efflux system [Dyadobacter soli]|uniref:Membrane fusion protein, multidrug efflux system n=1 Tax=Dyadobacter soli TaxID=659014 RepID=A0A1G6VJA5_9BACT|nr:HlyD family secretion protein [Dyadobacter soli]SDD53702.1 membrane fusion protein, multidrug efflux system [Dyadobacter soli]